MAVNKGFGGAGKRQRAAPEVDGAPVKLTHLTHAIRDEGLRPEGDGAAVKLTHLTHAIGDADLGPEGDDRDGWDPSLRWGRHGIAGVSPPGQLGFVATH